MYLLQRPTLGKIMGKFSKWANYSPMGKFKEKTNFARNICQCIDVYL